MKKQQNKKFQPKNETVQIFSDDEEKTIKKQFTSQNQQVKKIQQPSFQKTSKMSLIDETKPVQDIVFLEFVDRICNLFPVVWLENPEVESLKEDSVKDKMSLRQFVYDVPEINFVIDKPKQPTFYMQFVFSFHPSHKFMFRITVDDDSRFFAPFEEYKAVCVANGFSSWGQDNYNDFFDGFNSWCNKNEITFEALNLFCQNSAWSTTNFKTDGMYVIYDKSYSPALSHYVTRLDRHRKLKHAANLASLKDLLKRSTDTKDHIRSTQDILQALAMESMLERLETQYVNEINDVL